MFPGVGHAALLMAACATLIVKKQKKKTPALYLVRIALFQFKTIRPCPIATGHAKQCVHILQAHAHQVLKSCSDLSLEPSLLQLISLCPSSSVGLTFFMCCIQSGLGSEQWEGLMVQSGAPLRNLSKFCSENHVELHSEFPTRAWSSSQLDFF